MRKKHNWHKNYSSSFNQTHKQTQLSYLDSRTKFFIYLIWVIFLSIPSVESLKYQFINIIAILCLWVYLGTPFYWVLKHLLFALPFFLAGIFIPFIHNKTSFSIEVSHNGIFLMLRLWSQMFSIILFSSLWRTLIPFSDLIIVLKYFKFPQLFIVIFEQTYRYLFLISKEADSMRTAWKSRGGTWQSYAKIRFSFSELLSILYIRTINRAERINFAMVSRGYNYFNVSPEQFLKKIPHKELLLIMVLFSVLLFLRLKFP